MSKETVGLPQSGALASSIPLSFSFSKKNNILAIEGRDGYHVYYHTNISHVALSEVQRVCKKIATLEKIDKEEFEVKNQKYHEEASYSAEKTITEIDGVVDLEALGNDISDNSDLLDGDDDAPIIKYINMVLLEALKMKASDIHIETFEDEMNIRFRIDGTLRHVASPPKTISPILSSRVKVMAKLDISEKRLPQDGRITLKIAGRPIDVRVSTLPSSGTERLVLRILDKHRTNLSFDSTGMSEAIREKIIRQIEKPHGIFLVTGPTGSGKTTTLYTALSYLNSEENNILTIEDPVEYYIKGIGQTQVNPKIDLDFAKGLRAILRQDPDIVMIGEIRDLETAQIAVRSSQTGHLVLATLHTNTSIGAITRLRDMGVEPYLLSSSLAGILSQRLVKVLCYECKESYIPSNSEWATIGASDTHRHVYKKGAGCKHCNETGYAGRTGIYELAIINEEAKGCIHDSGSEFAIKTALGQSLTTLQQDGLAKVLDGTTSIEEVARIILLDD